MNFNSSVLSSNIHDSDLPRDGIPNVYLDLAAALRAHIWSEILQTDTANKNKSILSRVFLHELKYDLKG